MSEASDTKTINLLNNGEFQSRDISSDTVLELRTELDIPADSSVNIGGTVRQNDFSLSDGDYVSWTSNNKVGG